MMDARDTLESYASSQPASQLASLLASELARSAASRISLPPTADPKRSALSQPAVSRTRNGIIYGFMPVCDLAQPRRAPVPASSQFSSTTTTTYGYGATTTYEAAAAAAAIGDDMRTNE